MTPSGAWVTLAPSWCSRHHKAGVISLSDPPTSSRNTRGAAPARLTLQPTELQPRSAREFTSAASELRGDIACLAQLDASQPLFSAHLTLALSTLARRLDELGERFQAAGL